MKKALKYLDFTFLRFLPTVYIALTFCFGLLSGLLELNDVEFSLPYFLITNLYVLVFLLLGMVSIFKWFDKTVKFAKYAQYFLCFIAVIEVCNNLIYNYTFYRFAPYQYQPTFFETISWLRDELDCIALLVLAVCCLLKDKFYKTKWIFAISVTWLFFVEHSILSLFNLLNCGVPITFRFLLENLTGNFPIFAVSILGLAPVKQEKVGDDAHIIPQE
jgi:hypothetical protein